MNPIFIYIRNEMLILILLTLAYNGNSQIITTHQFFNNNLNVDSNNIPTDSIKLYMPDDLLISIDTTILSSYAKVFYNLLYSKYLYVLQEPLLYNKPMITDIYRLTLLKTMKHPISIRLIDYGDTGIMKIKVSSGRSGYFPSELSTDSTLNINNTILAKIKKVVMKFEIDSMKIFNRKKNYYKSKWLLECVINNKYYAFFGQYPIPGKIKKVIKSITSPIGKNKKLITN